MGVSFMSDELMDWGLTLNNKVSHREERAELKDKALNLLVCLHSDPNLWSLGMAHD